MKTEQAKFGPITLTGGYVNEKERKIGNADIPTFGPKGEFTGLNKTPVVRSFKNKRINLDGIPLLSGETPLGALSLTGSGEYAKSKEQVDVGKFRQVVEGRARTAGLNLNLGDDFKIVYTHIENKQTGQQKTTGQSINAKYVVSKTPEGEVTLYVDLGPKQEGSRKKTVGFNVKQRFEEGGFVSAT